MRARSPVNPDAIQADAPQIRWGLWGQRVRARAQMRLGALQCMITRAMRAPCRNSKWTIRPCMASECADVGHRRPENARARAPFIQRVALASFYLASALMTAIECEAARDVEPGEAPQDTFSGAKSREPVAHENAPARVVPAVARHFGEGPIWMHVAQCVLSLAMVLGTAVPRRGALFSVVPLYSLIFTVNVCCLAERCAQRSKHQPGAPFLFGVLNALASLGLASLALLALFVADESSIHVIAVILCLNIVHRILYFAMRATNA